MNKKKYNKYLYIPVEIYRRELNGMLILAITAAQSGWSVLLGGKRAIMPYLNKLPEGIVLVKSVVPGEYANLKKIKNEGHKITSLDAEGLILTQGPTGATERYSEQTIELADALFFWGKRQLRVAKYDFPSIQKRAHVTGSPIFDFWRYRKFFPAHTKKKLEKKCILIATSFSYPNHTISEEMAKKLLLDCIPKVSSTQSHLDLFFKTANLQRLVFPQFKKMVEGLFKSCPGVCCRRA
jgi:surface carbohydrate biosynthesis protein